MSSFTPIQQQVIALAGVVQAARMVDQVAKTGSYPAAFFEASLRSLFTFDAPTVDAVYGNIQGVKLGLRSVVDMLTDATNEDHVAMGLCQRLLKLRINLANGPTQEVVASRLDTLISRRNILVMTQWSSPQVSAQSTRTPSATYPTESK